MTYNISFELVAVVILVILLFINSGKHKLYSLTFRYYITMVAVILASVVLDMLSVICVEYNQFFSLPVIYLLNAAYLVVQSFIALIFTLYVCHLAEMNISGIKKKLALFSPYVISFIAIITSSFNGYIFYIDENMNYCHGWLYPLLYVSMIYYLALSIGIAVKYRKLMGKSKIFSIQIFVVMTIIAQIIQFFANHILLVPFVTSLVMVIIIYTVQSPDETFDKTNSMRRSVFFDMIAPEIAMGKEFAIISVRLIDIESIYKRCSSEVADTLVRNITSYIGSFQRKSIVFRADSNVFMVKIEKDGDDYIKNALDYMRSRFALKWKISNESFLIKASFGAIKCPDDAANIGELTDAVNTICSTKTAPNITLYASDFTGIAKNREILAAIKNAVLNNGFEVYYQPIYSHEKKRICAAEALIRLYDEKLGFISPEIFIPIAEKEGYILRIGRFVFEEVCRFYSENKLDKIGIDYIEVNLSAVQCMQFKLAEDFIDIMKHYGIEPEHMNFEITETSAIISYKTLNRNISIFSDYGIPLSLDDYGTGYSNISYIYNIPFEYMKVDKGILWSAAENEKAYITLKNTVEMAKKLNLKVIVEGVETLEQVKMLNRLECDFYQGYYFSKPVPGVEFITFVSKPLRIEV